MRKIESSSPGRPKDEPIEAAGGWIARTKSDMSSLLLELTRALRGYSFYGQTDVQRKPLLDRTFRAVTTELSRAGSIDLRSTKTGFQMAGLTQIVEYENVLRPLEVGLRSHGLERVRLGPTLTRNALDGFLDLLGQPANRFENPGCFARALSARDSEGLRLNDIDDTRTAATPKLSGTPPRASASLGSMLISSENGRPIAPTVAKHEKPTLESHPLDTQSADDRGERLRARLIELHRTFEDAAYRRRAADITIWAQDLWNEGLIDECYRALLVLADHAVGGGGRSESQARTAASCFAQLASGDRLGNLIQRATGSSATGVRAAQLLLQLGSKAVPAILDRICEEDDLDRTAPLHSLVLALGEASLPSLISAIEGFDDRRARIGIRLAGELQNSVVLPSLIKSLHASDVSRRVEAIRALNHLPGVASKNALALALSNNPDEVR